MQLDTLKSSIATLQKLRDTHYSQLDAGVMEELDSVLQQLRDASESSHKRKPEYGELAFRALRVVEIVIRTISNLADWVK